MSSFIFLEDYMNYNISLLIQLNIMCCISAKLFLILCEYVLVCTCTHGLIKKLVFLVCAPSIAQLNTIMHSFALFIQHNVCFLFLVIKFFLTKKIFICFVLHIINVQLRLAYKIYISCLCTLFSFDELILYALCQFQLYSACCV